MGADRQRFEGQNVVVTGGSRGLGAAVACGFAAAGAEFVAIGYRTRHEEAEQVIAELEGMGCEAVALKLDITDQDSVDAAFAGLQERGRPPDILINNAGIIRDAPVALMSVDDWTEVVDVNLTGTFRCCRAVARGMIARGGGVIVNISSVAGSHASPGQANYAASKGGLEALTRTLAAELAPRNVRVNAVVPGLFGVGMGVRLHHGVAKQRREAIPLGRFGDAVEFSDAVLFLASDAASYIVGQCLVVDGGLTL